jgi:hypothetical protein
MRADCWGDVDAVWAVRGAEGMLAGTAQNAVRKQEGDPEAASSWVLGIALALCR